MSRQLSREVTAEPLPEASPPVMFGGIAGVPPSSEAVWSGRPLVDSVGCPHRCSPWWGCPPQEAGLRIRSRQLRIELLTGSGGSGEDVEGGDGVGAEPAPCLSEPAVRSHQRGQG